MADIIDFPKKDDEKPKIVGPARCMCCRHEWVAEAPTGQVMFKCPECETIKGVFVNDVMRTMVHWLCGNCHNDVFRITPLAVYCVNCGNWSVPS